MLQLFLGKLYKNRIAHSVKSVCELFNKIKTIVSNLLQIYVKFRESKNILLFRLVLIF